MLWATSKMQPALGCTGSSWHGILVHRVPPSSPRSGLFLPKSHTGLSRPCRRFRAARGHICRGPREFLLSYLWIMNYARSALQAAGGHFLFLGQPHLGRLVASSHAPALMTGWWHLPRSQRSTLLPGSVGEGAVMDGGHSHGQGRALGSVVSASFWILCCSLHDPAVSSLPLHSLLTAICTGHLQSCLGHMASALTLSF